MDEIKENAALHLMISWKGIFLKSVMGAGIIAWVTKRDYFNGDYATIALGIFLLI